MSEYKILEIAEEVNSGTTITEIYTPPANSIIKFTSFSGHAAFSPNSVVKVIWDYGTPNEVILASTKGDVIDEPMYTVTNGDGVKKIGVSLENGENGKLVMSGRVKFIEIT